MNLLGIGIGREKDLIIGYQLKFLYCASLICLSFAYMYYIYIYIYAKYNYIYYNQLEPDS